MTDARKQAAAYHVAWKEHAMTPLVLNPESPRQAKAARTGPSIREAIVLLWGRPVLDHIREPEGLEHPMAQRSRRLMRNARVCGG
jgi:hypothetical protein